MDEVRDDWLTSRQYAQNMKIIAEHYGIYDDLFKEGYFLPSTALQVHYPYDNEQVTPVYSGNRLYAKDVRV